MITKICIVSGKEFIITDKDLEFYKKMGVPTPKLCPEERARRRTMHRNEQYYHHRSSCFSGENLVSIYEPEFEGKTCSSSQWFEDIWDPFKFGQDFDSTESFFDQFQKLQFQIPRAATVTLGNENCEFTTGTAYCRNCYLINGSEYAEDSLYSKVIQKGKDIVDCSSVYDSELLYECLNVKNCYNSIYLHNCENCSDSSCLKNCIGCKNCFGCVNLRNKEYYFLNQACTKKEWEEKMSKLEFNKFSGISKIRKQFLEFCLKFPHRNAELINTENSSGDYQRNTKNCHECYDIETAQDCKFVQLGSGNDLMDCSNNYLANNELLYEVLGSIDITNCVFCLYVFQSSDLFYCEQCFSCRDCFGCVGLRNKSFCVFNKQYTEKEYKILKEKIISHMKETSEWGEFFPDFLSPFPYNESLAQEYFPMSKEEATERGYKWREKKIIDPSTYEVCKIPDDITEVDDSVLKQTLVCENTGKPYRLVKPELQFYRKMNLPIPRLHPDERHRQRMALRNPRELYDRTCPQCKENMKTTYAPEKSEVVLCETCYLTEVN